MCIAGIKPSGVDIPDLETIKRCWNANKDGAGVAYPIKGGVQIRKGFTSAAEMHEFLSKYNFKDTTLLIHFRIGTHGLKSDPTHTHPFPVGDTKENMELLAYKTKKALIHNGILGSFAYDKDQSDTMLFARDCFPIIDAVTDQQIRKLMMEEMIGTSKVATLTPDGGFEKWGTWITDADTGMLWSNQSYKKFSAVGCADPRGWNNYDNFYSGGTSYGRYVMEGGRQVYKTAREIAEMEAAEKKGDVDSGDGDVVDEGELLFLDGQGCPSPDEFWSDYITINDYDTEELDAQYEVIRAYCPEGTRTCPVGMTPFEFDTYVTWMWHMNKITDEAFTYYQYHYSLPEDDA